MKGENRNLQTPQRYAELSGETVRHELDAFATSEAELEGAEETVLLKMNMSIEEVIALKGKPKTRVELGSKTVLTYDDLKLIFKDGKLVDAE